MHRELTPYEQSIPAEIEQLEAQSYIDIGFHLAVQTDEQLKSLPSAAERYGIQSFKLYLAYKGEAGKLQGLQGADDGFLYETFTVIRDLGGIACIHAENTEITERMAQQYRSKGRNDLSAWTESRPGWTEGEAIFRAGYIAHHAKCPLYVVHISSAEGVQAVERLRDMGAEIYAEVCIHHLMKTVDTAESFGSLAKVNPPLRYQTDVEALWDAIQSGVIDTIGTDHVAHTTQKAKDNIWEVMPGFSGSGTLLPALITEGYRERSISLSRLVELTSRNASRLFNLSNKGAIQVGQDADLTLVDLETEKTVDAGALHSASDYSLLQGQSLIGWSPYVISRGKLAMKHGQVMIGQGYGRYLKR